MHIKNRYFPFLLIFLYMSLAIADVVPNVTNSGKTVTVTNNTNTRWRMGGVRFRNEGFKWISVEGLPGYKINHNENNELDVYMHPTAPASYAKLIPNNTWTANHAFTTATDTEVIPGTIELLLKTGNPGSTDRIEGEAPIALSDISTLTAQSQFYDEEYRYIDSIGLRGGIHAGGIHDTWKGETQLQIAVPTKSITVNNADVTVDTSLHHYWMALAMGQEFFNIDAQYFAATSMQETSIGTSAETATPDPSKGVYSHWECEGNTGVDRALSFPQLFPKFTDEMVKVDAVSSLTFDLSDFMKYYTCGNLDNTPEKSALVLNGLVLAYIVTRANYNVYAYASDICWKEFLEDAVDPYAGPAFLLPSYFRGLGTSLPFISDALSTTNVSNTSSTSNTALMIPGSLGAYHHNIISIIKELENASKISQTTPESSDIALINPLLTKSEILDMFFGDGGTVSTQGNGGLLLHFYDPTHKDHSSSRQKIWDTLNSAFDTLQGKAPGSESGKISFRYDFLTLLRTVKAHFSFEHPYIISGDISMHVTQYSKTGGCNDFSNDILHPHAKVVGLPVLDKDFKIEVNGIDDLGIKEVTWTIDSQWGTWYSATYKSGSGTDQNFSITVPESVIKSTLGDKEGTLWYMVTDEAGNSVVKSLPIESSGENVAPTDLSLSTTTFPESLASGKAFAKIFSVDPNTGDPQTYSVVTPSSPFTIKAPDSLALAGDCPVDGDYKVMLKVTDGGNLSYEEEFTITITDVAPEEFTLTVTSGSGDGDYEEGGTANISADAPGAGFEFSHWESPIKCIADSVSATTTLTMPGQDLTIEAKYKAVVNPEEYDLTVTNGSGGGKHKQGESVNISANTAATGYEFDRWSSPINCIADTLSATTTLTMPGENLTIEALYKKRIFELKVTNGSGGGMCAFDSTVTITANAIEHHTFSHWSGDTTYIQSTKENQTTVKMPNKTISLEANFTADEYELTVTNGTGDGSYAVNSEVPVSAKDSSGHTFSGWSGDVVTFKNGGLKDDVLTMPAKEITIVAEYTADTVPTYALTVSDAQGDRNHKLEEGGTLAIEARPKSDSANVQFQFQSWSDPDTVLNTTTTAQATVTMKKSAATVSAQYTIFNYKVTDLSLTSSSIKGDATSGSTIAGFSVADEDVDDSYTFEIVGSSNDFVIEGDSLKTKRVFNSSEYNTTLEVTVKCSDKGSSKEKVLQVQILNPDQKTANLRLENGLSTTTTSYNVGSVIEITADVVNEKAFDKWTGETSAIVTGIVTDKSISVKIPDSDIILTATYIEQEYHTLTVNNGSGSTSKAISGEEIEVVALVPSGYSFTSWSGDKDNFKHGGLVKDTIQMPAEDVTITAHFTKDEGSHSLLEKLLEDNTIDGEDFVFISQEWNKYQQNSLDELLELAPYTGQRPNIEVNPDQKFDYNDLSSFTALCYYYSNLRKTNNRHTETAQGTPLSWKAQWLDNRLLISFSAEDIEDLLTVSVASEEGLQTIKAGELLSEDAEPFALTTNGEATVTRLTAGRLGVSGSGTIATLTLVPTPSDSIAIVTYTLRNSKAEVTSQGTVNIPIPPKPSEEITVTVTPTPCTLSENEELTFHIANAETLAPEEVRVHLILFDQLGDKLFEKSWTMEGLTSQFTWNGITDKGIKISSGTYKAYVQCTNSSFEKTIEIILGIKE